MATRWNSVRRMIKNRPKRERPTENPAGGWSGLKKGLRGRFAMYLPPLLEAPGLTEVEHNAKNNRVRAK